MFSARRNLLIFLCIVVLLTVLSVLGANLNFFGDTDTVKAFAKWGMVGVIGEIIALFVFVTKNLFSKNSYSIVIGPPSNLPGLDVTQISWDVSKCFINFGSTKKPIRPAMTPAGLAFEVRIPPEILEAITDTEPVDLELIDRNGLRWEIKPFYMFQRSVSLAHVGDRKEVIKIYGDRDE